MFNDIWLGKFDLKLNPISWQRGNFRFNGISLINDKIKVGDSLYNKNLVKIKNIKNSIENIGKYRYGCFIEFESTKYFAHLLSSCAFYFEKV